MNIVDLNDVLAGRKILSVEEGTTPGWMLINLEPPADAQQGSRVFLTVFVGGRRQEDSEDYIHWLSALHGAAPDALEVSNPIRDGRDANMRMGSARPFQLALQSRAEVAPAEDPAVETEFDLTPLPEL